SLHDALPILATVACSSSNTGRSLRITNEITTTRPTVVTSPAMPLRVSAYMTYPSRAEIAPTTAYGNWVETCVATEHAAPVLDKIVVSEIGELWSPPTAPAITAPKLA